jgi:ADP-ribose pyrophosphatase YjhB (NUDIX family)
MTKLQKHSIALVIPHPFDAKQLLAVLRPADDDELPNVWGLPAGSVRPGETPENTVRRVGRDKLALELGVTGVLAVGEQVRPDYTLTMTLYQARILRGEPVLPPAHNSSVTYYADWRWDIPESLRDGALKGSLCCQLALQHYRAKHQN